MNESAGDFSDILALLKDNPRGMSVTEIADAAHLNRNTIARYMDTLLVSGQVEMRTFGKAKVFFPLKTRAGFCDAQSLFGDGALNRRRPEDYSGQ